jgi:N-acetylglucosaminyl-diphospho-decaprenol L-rhamnosyltransferase
MHDLAVVIVNWNVRDLLRACLASVYADLATSGLRAQVWVVDNASQDGSPEIVRADFPQARLVVSPENLGFAGGNNLALRQLGTTAPPRYALLLNPDAELRPGALRTLLDFIEGRPPVGVAGARLFYGDGRFQHSAFRFPGLWQIAFDLFPLPSRLYRSRLNGRYPQAWYERGTPFPVDHPLGAAMMVRWEVIQHVGLFDQEFHMYCEEIDWCMRIKRAGWEIYCVPGADVVHHVGQSTYQVREDSFVNLWHSRRRLYDKHYGPLKRWLAKRLVRVGMRYKIHTALREGARGQEDETAAHVRAYTGALACFDGPRG